MTKSIDVLPTWYWPDGVARYVSPPRGTAYSNMVARWARRTPAAVAVRGPTDITYRELDEAVVACAAGLRRRLGESEMKDRVGLVASARTETVVALFAGLYAGVDLAVVDDASAVPPGCALVLGDGTAGTARIEELAASGGDYDGEPGAGRIGLAWNHSTVFHPDSVVAGWALAFRTFMQLESADQFVVFPSVAHWEGVVGVMAPMMVGSACVLPTASRAEATGALIGWDGAGVTTDLTASPIMGDLRWLLLSVEQPLSAQIRRRLARRAGVPVRTILGTPATGPVAATPSEWSIDTAVGIPFVGVDLVPLDETGEPAIPPAHLLAAARVGVKSSVSSQDSSVEGPFSGRLRSDGIVDTGCLGQLDANGFLYLRRPADPPRS